MTKYLLLLLGLALVGCSAPKHMREDTRVLGLYVQTVKNDAQNFSRLRDASTKARLANITALELKTLRAEQALQRDLQILQIIDDKERLRVLTTLQNASAALVAQRKEYDAKSASAKENVEKAKSALNFQLAKLTEASTALLKLGENRRLREEVEFYADFLKQLQAGLDKDKKNVEDTTKDATAKANDMAKANAAAVAGPAITKP